MNRRDFVANGSAFLGLTGKGARGFFPAALRSNTSTMPAGTKPRYVRITENAGIYRDVVNVGVIRSGGKTLLIDSGEARILEDAKDLRLGPVDRVLYTHYHRDQCTGASLLKSANARIDVPESEARFFKKATEFWLEADTILDHRYNFRPEIMVLRESVGIDGELRDGEILHWEGIPIRVVATPGHTDGSLSYFVDVDGETIAFTGDLIYGPGQIWEFYSLQKRFPGMSADYWGFGETVTQLLQSADTLLSLQPTLLVPSHGDVIHDPNSAVASLHERLDGIMNNYFTLTAWRISPRHKKEGSAITVPMLPPLPTVKLPSWLHKVEGADTSYCIIAEDKSIFLFDCGFASAVAAVDKLVESGEISGVDAIWPTHYHDDHVTSINVVREKYGARVIAQKEMQDILENPTAYCMPCLCPESIHVDQVLTEGERIHWKGYELTSYYFPGQTLYHAGLLIEHDGTRVFMSGDSFANWGIDDYCSYNRNFLGKDGEIAGYNRCLKLLLQLKPDLLCAAHWGPEPFSEDYLQKTLDLLREREEMIAQLFPWDDPNFGLDPYWISAYPYRQSILPGQRLALEARIYNHSDSPRTASVELRAPSGWQVEHAGSATIPAHTEGKIRLTAIAPKHPPLRRQLLGLAVHFDQRNLGEFTEAIVDYLQSAVSERHSNLRGGFDHVR